MDGGDYCIAHSPGRVTELAEWRRRGGKAKSNRARAMKDVPAGAMTTAEILAGLGEAFRRTRAGTMSPNVATALSNLARTMADLQRDADLEARMATIERALGNRAS